MKYNPTVDQKKGRDVIEHLSQQLSMLRSQRAPRDATDQALCEYLLPYRGEWLTQPNDNKYDKYLKILDPQATEAVEFAAAGMHMGLTNQARKWFKLALEDRDLTAYGAVKVWLEEVERRLYVALKKTGFYANVLTSYLDEMTFGGSCLIACPDPDNFMSWDVWSVGSYFCQQNDRKIVDTVFRDLWMTARQMVEAFGEQNCSKLVQDTAKKNPYTYYPVTQAIVPSNTAVKDGISTWADMPFQSFYWEGGSTAMSDGTSTTQSGSSQQLLSAKGYPFKPAIVTRWHQTGSDVYGVSPGHLWLNKIKQLQQYSIGQTKSVHNESDPALLIPEAMRQKPFSMLPGSKNYFTGDVSQIKRMIDFRYDYQGVSMLIADARKQLNRGLYADLMFSFINREGVQPLNNAEVLEIKDEKLLMLGAVVDRECTEKLEPVIDIVYAELERRGMLPPMPMELDGQEIKVEFISVLAQAAKLVNTRAIQSISGFTGQLAQFNPIALDKLNIDEAIEQYADAVGASATIIRGADEVRAIRQARQKAIEMQRQQEAINQQVQNVGALSKPIDPESALAKIEAGYGG
jgi:hypothetical protein